MDAILTNGSKLLSQHSLMPGLKFDGIDDVVIGSVGNAPIANAPFSIQVRLKPVRTAGTGTNGQWVMLYGATNTSNFHILHRSNGTWTFGAWNAYGYWSGPTFDTTLPADVYTTVTVVYDGGVTLKGYKDGVLIGTYTNSQGFEIDSATVAFGYRQTTSVSGWNRYDGSAKDLIVDAGNAWTDAQVLDAHNGKGFTGELFWKLSDYESGKATDHSGLDNHGTGYGNIVSTYTKKLLVSKSKQPYMLTTTTTQGVTLPDVPALKFDVAMSMCFWVRFTTTSNTVVAESRNNNAAYSIQTGGSNLVTGYGSKADAGRIIFFAQNAAGMVSTVNPINDGKMHHIVVTHDVNSTVKELYLDGVFVMSASTGFPDLTVNQWMLGARNGNSVGFGGSLVEPAFFNRVVTASEAKEIFLKGIKGTEAGLVAYYKPSPTNLAYTDVANGLHGTYVNVPKLLPSTAPVGQRNGLRINGSNGVVDVPHNVTFNSLPITVEAWVRTTAKTTYGHSGIVTKYAVGSANGYSLGNNEGMLEGWYYRNSATFRVINTNVMIADGKWHHVAMTVDTNSMRFYVDGILVNDTTLTTPLEATTSTAILQIGKYTPFNGIISNPRLWSKALSLSEIKQYMFVYLPATTPNLIEQFPMNEGVGSVIHGTKGNNGAITGTATWTQPSLMNWIGKCYKNNGTRQPVVIADSKSLDVGRQLTIEAWLYEVSTDGSNGKGIVTKGLYNSNDAYYELLAAGGLHFRIWTDGIKGDGVANNVYQFGAGSGQLPLNTWNHVAATYDGLSMKLYINGNLVGSISATGRIVATSQPMTIGQRYRFYNSSPASDISSIDGSLDDVRVWNIARTQTEIQENMNKTIGRHPNLVLNMGFESDYYDASGYGNHGVPVGNPVIEVTDNDKLLLNAPIN